MTRSRFVAFALMAAAAPVVQGCDVSPDGLDDDADDEQVNLESMLSVAGRADITHGTQPYRAPAEAPVDAREERLFVAFLSGGQEVPAIATKAEGVMALYLNHHQNRLRFVLHHQVADATVAHLHIGSAGENGPVTIALPKVNRSSAGVVPVTREQVAALAAGRLYVNVHSTSNPTGEIRGQVLRPGETVFVASLRGSEEVPAVSSTATGLASLILSARRDQVRYRITSSGIAPTLAHVHRGIAGVNGPVAHPLATTGAVVEGNFAVTAPDLEDLSLRRWYVNLHSVAHPKGELRGQVLRPGESLFAAKLTPKQEVPPVTSANTGNAMVVLGSAGAKFLYVVTTTATATLAHIHRAAGGNNGPVELSLDPLGDTMSGIRDLGPGRRADIERGLWYVNLHTAAKAKGELRGQLLRPGEKLFVANLAGANEVPPAASTATGAVAVILDAARARVRYDGATTGMVPTLAHVHAAPAGSNGPVVFPLAFTDTTVSGDQAVTSAQLATLDGAGLYVNLHSAAFPTGEIRGQLLEPDAVAAAPIMVAVPGAPAEPHQH